MSEYIITDGSRFVYRNLQGKYVPGTSEVMADVFTKKQAENILSSTLPKALRTVFHIEKRDIVPQNVRQVNKEDLSNNTEKAMLSENIQIWIDRLHDMNGLIDDVLKRKFELVKQLRDLEAEKIDIEHYIEFQNLNAAQGYKASMELKKCRMKRRAVKNELLVLEAILHQNAEEMLVKEVRKKIQQMDSRTYAPRIRKDLFDL